MSVDHDDLMALPDEGEAKDELTAMELANLFAAFDDVRASEDLKSRTLARIEEMRALEKPDADSCEPTPETHAQPPADNPRRASWRARWRAVRVAALAACLSLALFGGAAYAVPTAYVQIETGGATIELGVNRFGIAVSASSDSDEGREIIARSEPKNRPLEESLERVMDAAEEREPAALLTVEIAAPDEPQRERLQEQADEAFARREQAQQEQQFGQFEQASQPDRLDEPEQSDAASAAQPDRSEQPELSDRAERQPGMSSDQSEASERMLDGEAPARGF